MPTEPDSASRGAAGDSSPAAERKLAELAATSVVGADEIRSAVLAMCGRLRAIGQDASAERVYDGLIALIAVDNEMFDPVLFAAVYEVQRGRGMSHEEAIDDLLSKFDAAYRRIDDGSSDGSKR